MRFRALTVALALAACSTWCTPILAGAQEPPAQPQIEVDIATRFQEAASDLFAEWVKLRPHTLKDAALGLEQTCWQMTYYFTFISCEDQASPVLTALDVRKTDSILSPFLGILRVQTRESCVVKRAVPAKWNWYDKTAAVVRPFCIGKTYDGCIKGGAVPAPKTVGSACTGGPETRFPYEGDLTLSFRWSKGKWEFEREELKEPRTMPARLQEGAR